MDSAERIASGLEAFAEVQQAVQAEHVSTPVTLKFHGLSHFRHKVLYLDIVEDEELGRLKRIAELAQATFAAHGLLDSAGEGRTDIFTPHLTIAKLSQMRKKRRGKSGATGTSLRKLPQDAYKELLHVEGGQSRVQSVDLCQMQGRAAGSYYKVISSFPLDSAVAAASALSARSGPEHQATEKHA